MILEFTILSPQVVKIVTNREILLWFSIKHAHSAQAVKRIWFLGNSHTLGGANILLMSPEISGLTSTIKEIAWSCTKACVEISSFFKVTFGSYKWINKSSAFSNSFLIFFWFIYEAEKMLMKQLHKRNQTKPTLPAIACSYLMPCLLPLWWLRHRRKLRGGTVSTF